MNWSMNWKLKYGLVGIILGIVILCMSIFDTISLLKTPIEVNSSGKVTELRDGDHVKFDIVMSMGALISETTTETRYGVEVSSKESSRYYIIPFIDETGFSTLTVKLGSDNFSLMDRAKDIYNKYQNLEIDYPTDVLLSVDGIVKRMGDEEKSYTTDVQKDFAAYNIFLDYVYVKTVSKGATYGITALGGVFILVSIVLIIFFFKGRAKDKARLEEMRANNAGYYEAPQNITFNNDIANDPRFAGVQRNPQGYPVQPGQNGFNQNQPVPSQPAQFNPNMDSQNQNMQFDPNTADQNQPAQFDPSKITSDQINPGNGNNDNL